MLGQQLRLPLQPDQLVLTFEEFRPAAVGVDDVAVGIGAQHGDRAGLGDSAEQLADIVELDAQLLGFGHIEAGPGVALVLPVGIEEGHGPMVEPAVLTVAPGEAGRELKRGTVADRAGQVLADLGEVLGMERPEHAALQIRIVRSDAQEIEAGPVADARNALAIGQPQQHWGLVDETMSRGLAGAGIGEVEHLRQQVVGPPLGTVDRGHHGADPVALAVGPPTAEVALQVVAAPAQHLAQVRLEGHSLRGVGERLEPHRRRVVRRELHQIEEHRIGPQQVTVDRPEGSTDGRGHEHRGEGLEMARQGRCEAVGLPLACGSRLCCGLFSLHGLACLPANARRSA